MSWAEVAEKAMSESWPPAAHDDRVRACESGVGKSTPLVEATVGDDLDHQEGRAVETARDGLVGCVERRSPREVPTASPGESEWARWDSNPQPSD